MNSGHFQPLVSRRVTAIVEMHCGANTNHIRNASAVGSDQRLRIFSIMVCSPDAPSTSSTA